jgi:hypothetical protein
MAEATKPLLSKPTPSSFATAPAAASRTNSLAWWSAATILVSAFLLFQVQPVISKKILPWFGGSPAVWTTCVLFFQLVLLGGYAYAHWLIRYCPARWQGIVHISVLGLALLTFPLTAAGYWNITPSDFWKPLTGDWPALRILMLLAAKVGAPFFIASTTGPLVQAWFSQLYPGRSPYRLYSLSNFGSLAALLTYPFLIEPLFRVDLQGAMWSLGFLLFAGLVGTLAMVIRREAVTEGLSTAGLEPDVTSAEGLVARRLKVGMPEGKEPEPEKPPRLSLRVGWLVLAALASMAFLAITNHLSQDIAVVPFMWIIPLSLYLLSFIICFDNEWWYWRKTFGVVALLAIAWLTAMNNYSDVDESLEYCQKVVAAVVTKPKFDNDDEAEAYAKKSFREKINAFNLRGRTIGFKLRWVDMQADLPVSFSRINDRVSEGIGWGVEKLNTALNWIARDRTPVKLESGETFASLDKDKSGKLSG